MSGPAFNSSVLGGSVSKASSSTFSASVSKSVTTDSDSDIYGTPSASSRSRYLEEAWRVAAEKETARAYSQDLSTGAFNNEVPWGYSHLS